MSHPPSRCSACAMASFDPTLWNAVTCLAQPCLALVHPVRVRPLQLQNASKCAAKRILPSCQKTTGLIPYGSREAPGILLLQVLALAFSNLRRFRLSCRNRPKNPKTCLAPRAGLFWFDWHPAFSCMRVYQRWFLGCPASLTVQLSAAPERFPLKQACKAQVPILDATLRFVICAFVVGCQAWCNARTSCVCTLKCWSWVWSPQRAQSCKTKFKKYSEFHTSVRRASENSRRASTLEGLSRKAKRVFSCPTLYEKGSQKARVLSVSCRCNFRIQ